MKARQEQALALALAPTSRACRWLTASGGGESEGRSWVLWTMDCGVIDEVQSRVPLTMSYKFHF